MSGIPIYHIHDYKHEKNEPCFCCGTETRFYVVEFENWLCWDCIAQLTSAEYISAKRKPRTIFPNPLISFEVN